MRLSKWLVAVACFLIGAGVAAQEPANFDLTHEMSVADFQRAGLNKLNTGELNALNAWFAEYLAKQTAQPGTAVSRAEGFSDLDGAIVIADDGTFLGKITWNQVDSNSTLNEVGRYGSQVSSTSIINEVGRYGSPVSSLSPFNPVAPTPPRIFKGDHFLGYLTVNPVKTPRIDPRALIGWLKSQN